MMSQPPDLNATPRFAAILPTYQNARTLGEVLGDVAGLGLPMWVIDDGCTDGTADLLTERQREQQSPPLYVVTHRRNRGKAAALRSGFDAAVEAGFTHVLTFDTDGQHRVDDARALLAAARKHPMSLVLGSRPVAPRGAPGRNLVGRRFANLGVWLEAGVRLSDSQCGLRVYPLALTQNVRCRSGRYGYETEIITRAAWAGFSVMEVPVHATYLPVETRVSHFRPWRDTFLGLWLHFKLLWRTAWPWPHRRVVPRSPAPSGPRRPWWKQVLSWFDPRDLWRELQRDQVGRFSIAAGVALGTFVANLPAFGLQTVIALYVAKRFHVHPVAVVLGSQLSMPPIGIGLVAAAIAVGHFLLHGQFNLPTVDDIRSLGWSALAGRVLLEWLIGSFFVGLACCAVTLFGMLALLRMIAPAPVVEADPDPDLDLDPEATADASPSKSPVKPDALPDRSV